MLKLKIGLLTIGQSPREDILPELIPFLSPHLEIVEVGLLDGLNFEEIEDLKPEITESQLVSRLNDGNQVQLSEGKICKLLPSTIHRMVTERKVNAVGILCTHNFLKSDFSCPIIYPFDYLKFLVNFILKIKNLGVIIPSNDQIKMTENKWEAEKIVVEAKSPYNKSNSWRRIIQPFVKEKVEAIVLDCIGYKIMDKQTIQKLIPVPVLLPSLILVFAINQLF
jgi:protein AroM